MRKPGPINSLLDLVLALVLILFVAAMAGLIVVVLAWLYGAPGAMLGYWFAAGFFAALAAVALLFAREL